MARGNRALGLFTSNFERRDRALMACLLLTAMRDTAVIGLKVRDVDLAKSFVFQNPRHARTKFSKAIDSFFYPRRRR